MLAVSGGASTAHSLIAAFGPSTVLNTVLQLHGIAAYALVGGLAFGEAALFVGFVLPGETAVLLGGVLAYLNQVSLPVLLVLVVVAAIVGDSVGYEVGRHFGDRLLGWRIFHKRRAALDRAREYLRTKGGRAVFVGRFTAFLRAVMPGLAGTARLPYRRFLAFNAAGGLIWGVGFTMIGYAAGTGYRQVERIAGRASTGLLILIVVLLLANHIRRRRRERRSETETEPAAQSNAGSGGQGGSG